VDNVRQALIKKAHQNIETAGINDIRKLLMELGKGFAFLGNQVPIEIDGREYFIDMLFYHVRLHSYFIVELKATEFELNMQVNLTST
jgi:predicted nuclease of restriction endonuclease-like (RecB) superfamily